MVKANWWRPIPVLALLAVAATLSAAAGTPSSLPGVALGWPLLLHLERAVALVAGLALVVLVGVRATMGHFSKPRSPLRAVLQTHSRYDGRCREKPALIDRTVARSSSQP